MLCMSLVILMQYSNYSHFTSTGPILQASYFSPDKVVASDVPAKKRNLPV